ncbi:hypothetical protein [Pedobacter metabolipauper]|uniref:Uncharacterized protein n=1 Tax=Pedobacter metabolipauper TaxID=425513 RepID=A0A4V3D1P1_9SPHI|nr:hypothetical protein [Pedobacter metabolipauper]TDQ11953.1 hypothetical protein ATK78_1083 [Pedobacter metabolipauper]
MEAIVNIPILRAFNDQSMKISRLLLLAIFCVLLSSCFDTTETYTLNANGSYKLSYEVNVGSLFKAFKGMVPDSLLNNPSIKNKDTVINIAKATPDSVLKTLNKQQLRILANTNLSQKINLKEGLILIRYTSSGDNLDDMNYFVRDFNNIVKRAQIKSDIIPVGNAPQEDAESNKDKDVLPISNKEYDLIITPNSFERKIKPELMAQKIAKDKDSFAMLEGMNMKMPPIPYAIIINLPRAAKSVDNPKAVLSADKKQFKLEVDMMDAIKNPEMLNFKVSY